MSGITLHDFYWLESKEEEKEYYHLFFKENSMPCAELMKVRESVYSSELWIYKIGSDYIVGNDLDVLKLKTQVRAAQMINEMKNKVFNDPNLRRMRLKKNEKVNLMFSFYNDIVPEVAKNYFFGNKQSFFCRE